MKVFITGGTGFIGRRLTGKLLDLGHTVTVLSRSVIKAKSRLGDAVEVIGGNPTEPGEWQEAIGRCDAIVNLCGEPIMDRKWTPKRKQLLLNSRILPTRMIVEAIGKAERRPEVLVSGSAAGYYGGRGDEELTEDSESGHGFAARLCRDWEAEANKAAQLGVRVVNIRTGVVLGRGGGSLAKMVPPFKFYVGGPMGSGRQYMSWVHIEDHVGITVLALANKDIRGPINLTAPNPVTNREFAKAIGGALGKPSWLPVPGFSLKLMFGEGAVLLLEGQKVIPRKALDNGYVFKFEQVGDAMRDVLGADSSKY